MVLTGGITSPPTQDTEAYYAFNVSDEVFLNNLFVSANVSNDHTSLTLTKADGSTVTFTPQTGGGGADVQVQDDGSEVVSAVRTLNFRNAGVTVTADGSIANVDIPGGSDGDENPKHVATFRALDGNTTVTNNPGIIGFIKADNTQLQNASLSEAAAIEIPLTVFGTTQNPATDTPNDTAHQSLFDDASENGGYVILDLQRVGQTHISYVRAKSVSKQTDHYALSNLDWVNPETISEGLSWSVGAMRTSEVVLQDVKGLNNATPTSDGLQSAADKSKLDRLVAGRCFTTWNIYLLSRPESK